MQGSRALCHFHCWFPLGTLSHAQELTWYEQLSPTRSNLPLQSPSNLNKYQSLRFRRNLPEHSVEPPALLKAKEQQAKSVTCSTSLTKVTE